MMLAASPGTIVLVGNGVDFADVTPVGCRVLVDVKSLTTRTPPATWPDGRPCFFGVFTELEPDWPTVLRAAAAHRVRPAFLQDGTGFFPSSVLSTMPRWGLPIKELYRYAGETLAAAVARWKAEAEDLERRWRYDLADILQAYTMGPLYTAADVRAIAVAGVDHINARGPQHKAALCFAWDRLDGGQVPANAELQQTICRQTPGAAVFEPLPPIPPVNPTQGVESMNAQLSFAYRGTKPSGLGGKYVCLVDPADGSKVASVQRDGSLDWVAYGTGAGRFEAFLLANPASVSNLAAVRSSNDGEPIVWFNAAVFDLSKAE
jgi:hypothetical protein